MHGFGKCSFTKTFPQTNFQKKETNERREKRSFHCLFCVTENSISWPHLSTAEAFRCFNMSSGRNQLVGGNLHNSIWAVHEKDINLWQAVCLLLAKLYGALICERVSREAPLHRTQRTASNILLTSLTPTHYHPHTSTTIITTTMQASIGLLL